MQSLAGFRLSPQQQQLWGWHLEEPVYFSQCAVAIEGPINSATLKAACEQLVGRHEILRTTFHRQAGLRLPLQVIHDSLPPNWAEVDLTGAGEAQQAEINARLAAERRRPVDLHNGPLVRFTLLK